MIIDDSPREKYTIFSRDEFLTATFPEPIEALDEFSGIGTADLAVKRPLAGRRLTAIIPLQTSRFWQSQPGNSRLPASTRFVIAHADSLNIDDMNAILAGSSDADGFLLDIACLAPWHRRLLRAVAAPFLTNVERFGVTERERAN